LFAGTLLPYPDMGATLGIEIFIIFLLAFFEGVRLFLGRYLLQLITGNQNRNLPQPSVQNQIALMKG